MSIIKILGIDPSLSHFGYAFGTYNAKNKKVEINKIWQEDTYPPPKGYKGYKNQWDYERAIKLSLSLLDALSYDPHVVAIEMPYGAQSSRSAVSYGVCVGVLSHITISTILVRESDSKILATGSKKASKQDMINAAYEEHPNLDWKINKNGELQNTNEHMADAIWALKTCTTYSSFLIKTCQSK